MLASEQDKATSLSKKHTVNLSFDLNAKLCIIKLNYKL